MSTFESDDRLIPVREAAAIVGVSRAKIYLLLNEGKFPKPVKIGSATRFSERECHEWVAARIAERDRGRP
jgi:prophage regulatory protein